MGEPFLDLISRNARDEIITIKAKRKDGLSYKTLRLKPPSRCLRLLDIPAYLNWLPERNKRICVIRAGELKDLLKMI